MNSRFFSVRNTCQTHTFLSETQRASKYHNLVSLYIYINIYINLCEYQKSVKYKGRQQSYVDIIQSYTELIKQAINLCVYKGPLY
jgi:hypothetical protein